MTAAAARRGLAWALVAVLALVGVDVWLGPTPPVLVAVAGLAPWLFFAAWAVAVAAAIRRHRPLLGAAVVLVVVQVVVLLPPLRPWGTAPAAAAGTTFTVFDANVRYDNVHLAGIARQIAAAHPDVVALEELSTHNLPSLEATHVLDDYPYHLVVPEYGPRGFGLWSRLPLLGAGTQEFDFIETVHATIDGPGGPTYLVVVHTASPPDSPGAWSGELRALAAKAVPARAQPVLIVGDFNATQSMRQLRALTDHGFHDAATENGDGWHMTWGPLQLAPLKVLRLDHALYSGPLTVTRYRTGDAAGSDHLPLLFTVGRRA